jgi:hypothetical protein
MSGDAKEVEILHWEGKQVQFYPASGAIRDIESGLFITNLGYNNKALAEKRWADTRQAIIEGLAKASSKMGLSGIPQDMLAEIVCARAVVAAGEGTKAGNDAARFIFSIIGSSGEDRESRSHIEIKFSEDMAQYVVDKMIESK